MAYCRTQLPVSVPVQDLDGLIAELIRGIGMQVERQPDHRDWLIGTELPQPALRANEHVTLLCDWSNLRNTGELTIETRSGESMAHACTRAQLLFQQFCGTVLGPLGGNGD